jgi:acetyl/propionyl-CoA carboxylase alpha subunit
MNWVEIPYHGKIWRIPALKSQGRLWFHWQGETHVVEVGNGSRRGGADQGRSHRGVIQAPMPGKVTKVHVTVGERVAKGKALVVMEAMKMEYTLEADLDGTIAEVGVTPGQQVSLGQVIVRLDEETGKA